MLKWREGHRGNARNRIIFSLNFLQGKQREQFGHRYSWRQSLWTLSWARLTGCKSFIIQCLAIISCFLKRHPSQRFGGRKRKPSPLGNIYLSRQSEKFDCGKSKQSWRYSHFLGRIRRVKTKKENRKANGIVATTTLVETGITTKRRELAKGNRPSGSFKKVNNQQRKKE